MNKPEVEILILDDERERDKIYEQFFARLSKEIDSSHVIHPLLPETPTEALSILRSRRPCLVVLDMVLEGDWQKFALMIYQTIRAQRYAIALLSNNFNEVKSGLTMTSVLVELSSVPKLGFLPYSASIQKYFVQSVGKIEDADSIPSDTVEIWNFMLAEALGHGRHWRPKTEGEVTFLHLTDTHFGAVHPDFLNVVAMENGIANSGLHADYVLWTGDVTEHGYPSEFDAAYKFAQDIVRTKFVEDSCPVSVTPGNHDLCWPLALSSRLNLVEVSESSATSGAVSVDVGAGRTSGTKCNDTKRERKAWRVEDSPVNSDLWRFGLSPFQEFLTRLVGETGLNDGYRFLTHWVHLGFAILELPLEAHVVFSRSDQPESPPPFISEEKFKEITNSAIESFRAAHLEKSVCMVVLIHGRAPDNGSASVSRWNQVVAQICESGNPVIVLGGHEHANDHLFSKNRLTIIGAPLDEQKTGNSLTLPGVGFIRLSGLGTHEPKCDITKLEKSAGDGGIAKWELKKTRQFAINPSTGCWIDV